VNDFERQQADRDNEASQHKRPRYTNQERTEKTRDRGNAGDIAHKPVGRELASTAIQSPERRVTEQAHNTPREGAPRNNLD
jgi:hypothetical protein